MKGSKSTVCLAYPDSHVGMLQHRPARQRRLWLGRRPMERNVHCVQGTKRLGNEKSINQKATSDKISGSEKQHLNCTEEQQTVDYQSSSDDNQLTEHFTQSNEKYIKKEHPQIDAITWYDFILSRLRKSKSHIGDFRNGCLHSFNVTWHKQARLQVSNWVNIYIKFDM